MDSTDNIHRRYRHIFSLPSTYILAVFAYITSLLITLIVNFVSATPFSSITLSVFLVSLLLPVTLLSEYLILKRNLLANLRRIFFVSFSSNVLWLFVLALGLPFTLRSAGSGKYVSILILGIFVATCFRLLIFKHLFLNEIYKALPISFAQPMVIGLAVSYPYLLPYLIQQPLAYVGGVIFVTSIIVFMLLLDKKGEQYFKEKPSKFIRTFLLAWLARHPDEFEKTIEKASHEAVVGTTVLSFEDGSSSNPVIVVTDVHPGPFYPVGSSNLPYTLHEWFRNHGYSPMILHSVSDHNLNLPSKEEVRHFLLSLDSLSSVASNATCTKPVVQTTGRATVTGIAFKDTVLLTLTLSPYGSEDFPKEVRDQLEKLTKSAGFQNVVVIDSHNSQGGRPTANDQNDVYDAAHQTLKQLRESIQYPFKVGFSHSSEFGFLFNDDVGPAGISVLVIEVDGKINGFVGVDANNARTGLREVLMKSSEGSKASILELCTTDTHSTISVGGEDPKGYFALGDLTDEDTLTRAIQTIKDRAMDRLEKVNLTVKIAVVAVKVMGAKAFDNFSIGLDKTLSFAKKSTFALATIFLLTLILTSLL